MYGTSIYIICSAVLIHEDSIYQEHMLQNSLLFREHGLGPLLDSGDSDMIEVWALPARNLQMEGTEADKLPIMEGKLGNAEVSWGPHKRSCLCMLPLCMLSSFPLFSLLTTPS